MDIKNDPYFRFLEDQFNSEAGESSMPSQWSPTPRVPRGSPLETYEYELGRAAGLITPRASVALLGVTRSDIHRAVALLQNDAQPSPWAVAFKRGLDLLVSSLLIIVAAPALLAIAIAIRLESPGPVMYRQTRLGRGGMPFYMLKFRTMSVADVRPDMPTPGLADGRLFRLRRDPRVTEVGRFLRRFSLDELPQLINVIRGEMSLVGPRPMLRAEIARADPQALGRLRVLPGLTGLWQISGRTDLSWAESIRLDHWYVEHWSPFLDLVILWRTMKAVWERRWGVLAVLGGDFG